MLIWRHSPSGREQNDMVPWSCCTIRAKSPCVHTSITESRRHNSHANPGAVPVLYDYYIVTRAVFILYASLVVRLSERDWNFLNRMIVLLTLEISLHLWCYFGNSIDEINCKWNSRMRSKYSLHKVARYKSISFSPAFYCVLDDISLHTRGCKSAIVKYIGYRMFYACGGIMLFVTIMQVKSTKTLILLFKFKII